jgi:hypothetical protein
MRLFMGLDGLKLLYQGILEQPGQLISSGDPQSSNILFNCSGYNKSEEIIFNMKHQKKFISDQSYHHSDILIEMCNGMHNHLISSKVNDFLQVSQNFQYFTNLPFQNQQLHALVIIDSLSTEN